MVTGYTDSHSYLDLTLTDSSLGDIYTCTVDLPGEPAVKSVQLAVKFCKSPKTVGWPTLTYHVRPFAIQNDIYKFYCLS